MKPKLAFIDHSFHQKTRSTFFLRDILASKFEIINLWDESWKGNKNLNAETINRGNYDKVLFFQSILPQSELAKIRSEIIFVPMYDSIDRHSSSLWLKYKKLGVKVINFSRTLDAKMLAHGVDCLYVQFFPKPQVVAKVNQNKPLVYFWQRQKYPNFETLKKLFNKNDIAGVIYKQHPDPGIRLSKLSDKDKSEWNVSVIEEFQSPQEFEKTLKKASIYIAPRLYEGIGMSFLEAMALGMVVVSPNNPTMNEYITDGENGFLYRPKREQKLNLNKFNQIKLATKKTIDDGANSWESDKIRIINFVAKKKAYNKLSAGQELKLIFLPPFEFVAKVIRYIEFKILGNC